MKLLSFPCFYCLMCCLSFFGMLVKCSQVCFLFLSAVISKWPKMEAPVDSSQWRLKD